MTAAVAGLIARGETYYKWMAMGRCLIPRFYDTLKKLQN